MTRENKLSLVIGFGLMLFVGILVSDHFAAQRYDPVAVSQSDPVAPEESVQLEAVGLEQLAAAEPVMPAGPVDLAAGGSSAHPDAVAVAPAPAMDAVTMPVEVAAAEGTPVRFRKVQQGDSYWKIAKAEYGDGSLAQKLQDYNKAVAPDAAKLALGSELRIPPIEVLKPGAAAATASPAMRVASAAAEASAAAAPRADSSYRVQKGDTAYGIARKRGIKAAELLRHNGISDPAQLKPGQTLRIPARY